MPCVANYTTIQLGLKHKYKNFTNTQDFINAFRIVLTKEEQIELFYDEIAPELGIAANFDDIDLVNASLYKIYQSDEPELISLRER